MTFNNEYLKSRLPVKIKSNLNSVKVWGKEEDNSQLHKERTHILKGVFLKMNSVSENLRVVLPGNKICIGKQ